MYQPRLLAGYAITAMTVLGACSTPGPVLEMARVTSTNAAVLDARLHQYTKIQSVIAAGRLESIRNLEDRMGRLERDRAFEQDIAVMAGDSRGKSIRDALLALSKKQVTSDEAQAIASTKRAADLAATQAELTVPSKELASVSEHLAALSQELTFEEQVDFFFEFAKSVVEDVKEKEEQAKKEADKGAH